MKSFNDFPSGYKRKIMQFISILGGMVITNIPSRHIRRWFYNFCGADIANNSVIFLRSNVFWPKGLRIDRGSSVGWDTMIDARGGIDIGKNVTIASYSRLISAKHDLSDSEFPSVFEPITIADYAGIYTGATVLGGVKIGRGAVVCAGAVVTRDVIDMAIVAGIPAQVIGRREVEPTFIERCAPMLH